MTRPEAEALGFRVVPNDDATAWLVAVPARPRAPANLQGEFKNEDRAWSAARVIAASWRERVTA